MYDAFKGPACIKLVLLGFISLVIVYLCSLPADPEPYVAVRHRRTARAASHTPWLFEVVDNPSAASAQDVGSLLQLQAPEGYVSLTLYDVEEHLLLLNWVYSLVRYGHVSDYIVATVRQDSLEDCLQLQLPCWDASGLLNSDEQQNENQTGELQGFLPKLKWRLVHELLLLGWEVHYSDVDTVFVRDVWASFDHMLDTSLADVSMMSAATTPEEQRGHPSHMVVLNSPRTVAMAAALAQDQQQGTAPGIGADAAPAWLNNSTGAAGSFGFCNEADACYKLRLQHIAAVTLFAQQGGRHRACLPVELPHDLLCAPWQVALHYHCQRGTAAKVAAMQRHQVMHFRDDGTDGPLPSDILLQLPCAGKHVANLQEHA